MSNQLEISSYYEDSAWVVKAKVRGTSDEDFPRHIFLWTVGSAGELDSFRAIAHVDEVAKYPLYDSARTNNFGIRQVRHDESYVKVPTKENRDDCITVLKSAFNNLLMGWENETKVVVEVYP